MSTDVIILDDETSTQPDAQSIVTNASADVTDLFSDNPNIRHNSDGTITQTLLHPITIKLETKGKPMREENVTEVTFRRPKGADLKMMMRLRNKEDELIEKMFISLGGIQGYVFDRMDFGDIAVASEIINSFLPQSLTAGAAT